MTPAAWFDFSGWLGQVRAVRHGVLILLALALVTLLSACATPAPQPLTAAPAKAQPIVVATLATNSCELQTAPAYTAATLAVRVAESRLRAGTLSLPHAESVLALGRRALGELDAACPGKQLDPARLRAAQDALAAMRSILGD